MAATGEFIGSAYELAFLEPGSASAWYDLSTYVNQDSLTRNLGEAETTAHGTTARTYIPGLKEATVSFTLMHNTVAAYAQQPQTRIQQFYDDRTTTTWRIRERGTGSGLPELQFSAFVTEASPDYTNDDQPVSSSVSLRITGAITSSQQA